MDEGRHFGGRGDSSQLGPSTSKLLKSAIHHKMQSCSIQLRAINIDLFKLSMHRMIMSILNCSVV